MKAKLQFLLESHVYSGVLTMIGIVTRKAVFDVVLGQEWFSSVTETFSF